MSNVYYSAFHAYVCGSGPGEMNNPAGKFSL